MSIAGAIKAGEAYVRITADNSELQKGLQQAKMTLKDFGAALGSMGANLMQMATATTLPMAMAINNFSKFDDQLRSLKAVSGMSATALSGMEAVILNLGANTAFTSRQVAEASTNLARMGLSGQTLKNGLQATINLTRATGEATHRLGDIATYAAGALNGFHLAGSQFGRVADVMTAASNRSAANIDDIGEAMKIAAPSAYNLGKGLEETAGALMVLADANIRGTLAGTALRNVYMAIADKGKDAFAELGVSVTDQNNNLRRTSDIFRDLGAAIQTMPKADQLAWVTKVFGVRGSLGALNFLTDASKWQAAEDGLQNVYGLASATAKEIETGIGGQLRKILGQLEIAEINFGKAFEFHRSDTLDALIAGMQEFNKWLKDNKDTAVFFIDMAAGIAVAGVALMGISMGIKIFTGFSNAIKMTTTYFANLGQAGVSAAKALIHPTSQLKAFNEEQKRMQALYDRQKSDRLASAKGKWDTASDKEQQARSATAAAQTQYQAAAALRMAEQQKLASRQRELQSVKQIEYQKLWETKTRINAEIQEERRKQQELSSAGTNTGASDARSAKVIARLEKEQAAAQKAHDRAIARAEKEIAVQQGVVEKAVAGEAKKAEALKRTVATQDQAIEKTKQAKAAYNAVNSAHRSYVPPATRRLALMKNMNNMTLLQIALTQNGAKAIKAASLREIAMAQHGERAVQQATGVKLACYMAEAAGLKAVATAATMAKMALDMLTGMVVFSLVSAAVSGVITLVSKLIGSIDKTADKLQGVIDKAREAKDVAQGNYDKGEQQRERGGKALAALRKWEATSKQRSLTDQESAIVEELIGYLNSYGGGNYVKWDANKKSLSLAKDAEAQFNKAANAEKRQDFMDYQNSAGREIQALNDKIRALEEQKSYELTLNETNRGARKSRSASLTVDEEFDRKRAEIIQTYDEQIAKARQDLRRAQRDNPMPRQDFNRDYTQERVDPLAGPGSSAGGVNIKTIADAQKALKELDSSTENYLRSGSEREIQEIDKRIAKYRKYLAIIEEAQKHAKSTGPEGPSLYEMRILELEKARNEIELQEKRKKTDITGWGDRFKAEQAQREAIRGQEQQVSAKMQSGDFSGAQQLIKGFLSPLEAALEKLHSQYGKAATDAYSDNRLTESERTNLQSLQEQIRNTQSQINQWRGRMDSVNSQMSKRMDSGMRSIGGFSARNIGLMMGGAFTKTEDKTAANTAQIAKSSEKTAYILQQIHSDTGSGITFAD